jgi:hypothetical protein
VVAARFVIARLADDMRWSWNVLRQTLATSGTYAGRDWRERHLAAEDAALFRFNQYDPGGQHLRWDDGDPVSAELLLTAPGAALFRIR